MSLTRVLRTHTETISHTFYAGETATDSTTTVTYAVTDANGDAVTSGSATQTDTGTYEFTLPGQSQLTFLTVTWAATISGAAVEVTTYVEVVGGHFFTLAKLRGSDSSLADTERYPTARLDERRTEAEVECEVITEQAFVPRYRRAVVDGSGTQDLLLPDGGDVIRSGVVLKGIRTVRAARVAPRVGESFVALTADELAALTVTSDGLLRRTDGRTWREGVRNVIVEYEYGSDQPPPDLIEQAVVRCRWLLNKPYSGVPERATSFQASEGGFYRLDTPGRASTGIPDVDAVYTRYSRGAASTGPDGKPLPASRQLNYDPAWYSLFHGGVR